MTVASGASAIQEILNDVFAHEDMLGVVAASADGLVLGVAGVPEEQAALVAALGAPLANVARRTIERINAGEPGMLSIAGGDGLIHVLGGPDVTLVLLTESCDARAIAALATAAMRQLAGALTAV